MRILQVINNLQYGGIEKLAIELSAGLKAAGHDSLICCLEEDGPLATEAATRGLQVVALGKRNGMDLRLVPRLAALIRQERIGVVHTHNMSPLLYGTLAACLVRVRALVNTRHGREEKRRSPLIWWLNDAVVAISEDAKRRLLAYNRLDARGVRVIYNGIAPPPANGHAVGELKQALGAAPHRRLIGTVGRLAPEKDHATLLRAFARLVRAGCDADLLIVGDGPLRPALQRLAGELGLDGRVVFCGFRQDARQLLRAFELFVLPSLTEGIALTLLEAMAAGIPVVVTEVGGSPEVVVDGVTGLLVPTQQPEALSVALGAVLSHPTLGRQLGEAGRARFEEYFSLARMVRAYEHLYETLSHH